MKIKLRSYADAGTLEKERLVMDVLDDVNLGSYAILKSAASSNGGATSGYKIAYWFPNKEVKKGDVVVLYTKTGTASTKQLESGTAYFYYWHRKEVSWGKASGSVAVLLEAPEWQTLKATW